MGLMMCCSCLYLDSSELSCCHESGLTLPPTPTLTTYKYRDLIIWHENRSLTHSHNSQLQKCTLTGSEKIGNLFHDICVCHLVCCFSWSNNPTLVSKSLKSSRVRSIRADIWRLSKECSVPSILILLKFSTIFSTSLSSSFCGTIVWRKRKFLLLWINLSGTEIYRRRSRSYEKRCAYF